jgi:hypothetical protein
VQRAAASQHFNLKEPADMKPNDPTNDAEESRVETITAALVYLMTHYARTGCPRLAVCVSRHLQALALHPGAAPVLRDTCAALHGAWAACEGSAVTRPGDEQVH